MSRGPPQPRPDYNSHPRWRGPFRVPGRKSRGPPRRCPPRASDPASRARPRVSAGPHRVPRLGLAVVARGSGRRAANPRRDPGAAPNGGRARAGLPAEPRRGGRAGRSGGAEGAGLGGPALRTTRPSRCLSIRQCEALVSSARPHRACWCE